MENFYLDIYWHESQDLSNTVTKQIMECLNIRSSGNKIGSKSADITYKHGTLIQTVNTDCKEMPKPHLS
jgi:hypothetical protein